MPSVGLVMAAVAAAAAHGARGADALRRNLDWRTNLALLESGVAHQPTNAKLRYNLGMVYHREAPTGERTPQGGEAPKTH